VWALLASALLGCGVRASPAPPAEDAVCDYHVAPPERGESIVDVSVRCATTRVTRFAPADRALAEFVSSDGARAAPWLPAQLDSGRAELSYRVDLGRMSAKYDSIDIAARFGTSLLAPSASFLLEPDPLPVGLPVRVRVGDRARLTLGLRRAGTVHTLEAHELEAATYAAFSPRELTALELPGQSLTVALLDGELDLEAVVLWRWVETFARAVQGFYGAAPDGQLLVVLAPVAGAKGVRFGKLLPESAPGIVLLVGEHTSERELYSDWILVHELFHVGSPSFDGEGKWFDEGLATYFEPIIRVRAGYLTERDLWREFFRHMPDGVGTLTGPGLERAHQFDEIYWGGALFCLLSDVEARVRTNNARGLEHGVRGLLAAGGIASEVWSLAEALATADKAMGVPVLVPLGRRYADQGAPVPLFELFDALGVRAEGDRVELDDTAPLAGVRRAIVRGGNAGAP
jgi:hypothetical protein